MKNLSKKEIKEIKEIEIWTSTKFHGNRKKVGSLSISDLKDIVAKKNKRLRDKDSCNTKKTDIQKLRELISWSIKCKGTGYFKVLIEGHSNIYYASPDYEHSDYNKSRMFAKNDKNLKLMRIFNSIVNKNNK